MKPTLSLDHVHYRSSDFDKTRTFYVGIMDAIDLGTVDLGPEGKRTPNLQLALGGATLLFALSSDPPEPVPANERLGVYHIAFLVADCDAATEYYRSKGAQVALEPFDAGDDIRASFLCAPDGMWVELKQDQIVAANG